MKKLLHKQECQYTAARGGGTPVKWRPFTQHYNYLRTFAVKTLHLFIVLLLSVPSYAEEICIDQQEYENVLENVLLANLGYNNPFNGDAAGGAR